MNKFTLLFTLKNKVGSLQKTLKLVKDQKISLNKIESRPSTSSKWDYDFIIEFSDKQENCDELIAKLEKSAFNIRTISLFPEKHAQSTTQWFPKTMRDLDSFATKVLDFSGDLSVDHPGFKDKDYRKRRQEITEIAKTYKTGMQIPRIKYNDIEKSTWRTVYEKLVKMYPDYACKEHLQVFPLLVQNCGYSAHEIPQIEDISNFLKGCTGFTLRPVMGLLSSRDFLNGLAFRVFHSTQYIRHHSKPFYTPEPDICHELLGHVPLFADPDFADFSQQIGLCSLGISDEDIVRLANIYWFTVEFGLVKEDNKLKAYGGGILSSFGELEYCLSDKPLVKEFDPYIVANQEYPITKFQPIYFAANSFKDMQNKLIDYSRTLSREFEVSYNPLTQTIDILDNCQKVGRIISTLNSELENASNALKKLR